MRALIVGTGLIGASVGAGLKRNGWSVDGWDPSSAALEGAMGIGGIDRAVDSLAAATSEVDFIVLSGPLNAILTLLPTLRTKALVTDVAGVKTSVVSAGTHLSHFVGGHPMAGRESSGPGSASAAMFKGATWILVTDGAAPPDVDRMAEIVESLGAVALRMSAADHDAAVAAVSHVPQVVASALVNLVARDPGAMALAAGGFRDVTRIALSEPAWWTHILTENRSEVARLIRALGDDLTGWAAWVEAQATDEIGGALDAARVARRGLTAPVVMIHVLLEDRPGEIARIGHALAATGADVRDLQLRHATQGGGGVLTLSIVPGQEEGLASALVAEGFRIVD